MMVFKNPCVLVQMLTFRSQVREWGNQLLTGAQASAFEGLNIFVSRQQQIFCVALGTDHSKGSVMCHRIDPGALMY